MGDALLVVPLDGLDPVGVPKDLQPVRLAVDERALFVRFAVVEPHIPETTALAVDEFSFGLFCAVGMPCRVGPVRESIGKCHPEPEHSVGVVVHLRAGKQVGRAAEIPETVRLEELFLRDNHGLRDDHRLRAACGEKQGAKRCGALE